MTTRCAFKIEDPSRGPGRVDFRAPDEGFGLEGTPKPKIQRDPSPQKGNLICGTPLYGEMVLNGSSGSGRRQGPGQGSPVSRGGFQSGPSEQAPEDKQALYAAGGALLGLILEPDPHGMDPKIGPKIGPGRISIKPEALLHDLE